MIHATIIPTPTIMKATTTTPLPSRVSTTSLPHSSNGNNMILLSSSRSFRRQPTTVAEVVKQPPVTRSRCPVATSCVNLLQWTLTCWESMSWHTMDWGKSRKTMESTLTSNFLPDTCCLDTISIGIHRKKKEAGGGYSIKSTKKVASLGPGGGEGWL